MTQNWEQILRDHGRSVWRTACRIVREPADADDCMQEAFLDAVELSRRQVVRDWGPLLRRIATSRALDRLRKTIRHGAREDAGEDVGAIACDDPASDPERRRRAASCTRSCGWRWPGSPPSRRRRSACGTSRTWITPDQPAMTLDLVER